MPSSGLSRCDPATRKNPIYTWPFIGCVDDPGLVSQLVLVQESCRVCGRFKTSRPQARLFLLPFLQVHNLASLFDCTMDDRHQQAPLHAWKLG